MVITAQVVWEALDPQPDGYQVRVLSTNLPSGCTVTVSVSARDLTRKYSTRHTCATYISFSPQGSPFNVSSSTTHLTIVNEGHRYPLKIGVFYLAQVRHIYVIVVQNT